MIRSATQNDLDLLLRWGRALHDMERVFEPQLMFDEAEARKRYESELQNSHALFLIAEYTKQPSGYLYAYVADAPPYFAAQTKHCTVEVVYVEPQARGYGIAQDLIARCLAWAREADVSRVAAGIYAANEPSIRSFAKQGFVPYHTTMVHTFDKL